MSINEIEKLQNFKEETDKFAFIRKKKLKKVLFTLSGEDISLYNVH